MIVLILLFSSQVMAQQSDQQQDLPRKKIQVTELEKFDPEAQINTLSGYQMRGRKIIVPAGVSIAKHGHKTRPGIVYVESGEVVEYRGDKSRLLKAGDSLVEDYSTVHSYKNVSGTDCVLIAFDIPSNHN